MYRFFWGSVYFPSKIIKKITISLVLEFVDRTLHENNENWYQWKLSHPQFLITRVYERLALKIVMVKWPYTISVKYLTSKANLSCPSRN